MASRKLCHAPVVLVLLACLTRRGGNGRLRRCPEVHEWPLNVPFSAWEKEAIRTCLVRSRPLRR